MNTKGKKSEMEIEINIQKKHVYLFGVFVLLFGVGLTLAVVSHPLSQITTTPTSGVSVDANGDGIIDNASNANTLGGQTLSQVEASGGSGGSLWTANGANKIYFPSSGTSGKVGINNNNPSAALDVLGTIKATTGTFSSVSLGGVSRSAWPAVYQYTLSTSGCSNPLTQASFISSLNLYLCKQAI